MTDNEKRAHDIAVCAIPILYKLMENNAVLNGDAKVDIDIHALYMEAYTRELNAINKAFPIN